MLRHRLLRVNNVLGKVFVPFILALLYFGYNLAVFQIGLSTGESVVNLALTAG